MEARITVHVQKMKIKHKVQDTVKHQLVVFVLVDIIGELKTPVKLLGGVHNDYQKRTQKGG